MSGCSECLFFRHNGFLFGTCKVRFAEPKRVSPYDGWYCPDYEYFRDMDFSELYGDCDNDDEDHEDEEN